MSDTLVEMNLAEMIRAEETMSDEEWIEQGDAATEALEAAGILVSADYPGTGWFPHPDWVARVTALGLSSKDNQTVFDYVEDKWSDSLRWMESLYEHGIERAIKAYARRAKQKGFIFEQPDSALSAVEAEGGNMFVILRNVNGELARYVSLETSPTKADYDEPTTWWRLEYVEPKQEAAA